MTYLTAAVVVAVAFMVCATALLLGAMFRAPVAETEDGIPDTVIGRAEVWNVPTEELSMLAEMEAR